MLVLEDHHSLGTKVRSAETISERQSILLFQYKEMTGLSQEHRVSFECPPSNTTHFMQPLDVAVFGPLKKQWRAILNK